MVKNLARQYCRAVNLRIKSLCGGFNYPPFMIISFYTAAIVYVFYGNGNRIIGNLYFGIRARHRTACILVLFGVVCAGNHFTVAATTVSVNAKNFLLFIKPPKRNFSYYNTKKKYRQ